MTTRAPSRANSSANAPPSAMKPTRPRLEVAAVASAAARLEILPRAKSRNVTARDTARIRPYAITTGSAPFISGAEDSRRDRREDRRGQHEPVSHEPVERMPAQEADHEGDRGET